MIFHGFGDRAKECKLGQRTHLGLDGSGRQGHLQLLMRVPKFAEVVHGQVRGMHVTCLTPISITDQDVDKCDLL